MKIRVVDKEGKKNVLDNGKHEEDFDKKATIQIMQLFFCTSMLQLTLTNILQSEQAHVPQHSTHTNARHIGMGWR